MTGGLRVLSAPSGRDSDKVCLTLDGAAATASSGFPESRATNPRMKMKNILIMSHPHRCGDRKMRSEERVIPRMCFLETRGHHKLSYVTQIGTQCQMYELSAFARERLKAILSSS